MLLAMQDKALARVEHRHKQRRAVLMTIVALAAFAAVLAMLFGNYGLTFSVLLQAWWLDSPLSAEQQMQWYILSELRLPRVCLAALVGSMLGMAGCAMQGLVRNPLADPGLIGISGGAAATAALSMAVFPAAIGGLASYWVALWAFAGALLAVWAVVRVATHAGGLIITTLILAGVAINALTGTVIGAVSYIASDDALRQISYWTMGSLGGADWQKVMIVAATAFICVFGLLHCRRALNLFALGEREAAYLGLPVRRYKYLILWLVAFSVAMATSLCGIIAFVGLVVPHICRSIIGVDHRYLLPSCGVAGALLLVVADIFSRSLFAPLEIPIGIVTSAVGGPFFLYLLWRQKSRLHHVN